MWVHQIIWETQHTSHYVMSILITYNAKNILNYLNKNMYSQTK